MGLRTALLILLALAFSAGLAFHLMQRQLSRGLFAFAVHPDVLALVERSREDQKLLARLDPALTTTYRARFDEAQRLLSRLHVLEYSRQQIVRRYEIALLVVVGGLFAAAGSGLVWGQARRQRRLARLQAALTELAAGRRDVRVGGRRRRHDLIGRIGRMVEQTSRRMARDRQRLASLENLSAWQEAARRHAHEMRTPLAAARLELSRMADIGSRLGDLDDREELRRLERSVVQELERLAEFTRRFTSFARLHHPQRVRLDLAALGAEFIDLFASAWPELDLRLESPAGPVPALADAEMLRQVLVNLGDNAAHALRDAGRRGTLTLSFPSLAEGVALDVADDGPGVAPLLRGRLFEPYTTTRRIGDGMGLGLAIARKILLDHEGDLELLQTSSQGTTFRLLFPEIGGEAEV